MAATERPSYQPKRLNGSEPFHNRQPCGGSRNLATKIRQPIRSKVPAYRSASFARQATVDDLGLTLPLFNAHRQFYCEPAGLD